MVRLKIKSFVGAGYIATLVNVAFLTCLNAFKPRSRDYRWRPDVAVFEVAFAIALRKYLRRLRKDFFRRHGLP